MLNKKSINSNERVQKHRNVKTKEIWKNQYLMRTVCTFEALKLRCMNNSTQVGNGGSPAMFEGDGRSFVGKV